MNNELNRLLSDCVAMGIELAVVDGQLDIYSEYDLTDEMLARLKQHKASLLELLSQQSAEQPIASSGEQIAVIERDAESYLMSSAQQRIWFVDKLEQGSAHFNMTSAIEVIGDIRLDLVEAAFNLVIARHETLRTVFSAKTNQQRLLPHYAFGLEQQRIDCADADEFSQQVNQAINFEGRKAFNLQQDLMVRASFYGHYIAGVKQPKGVLLFTLHHIAGDGWSLGLLEQEFVACYQALYRGEQPQLAPLSVQYIDYVNWQQKQLDSGDTLQAQNYWQQHLANAPQLHGIPLDFARPSMGDDGEQLASVVTVGVEADIAQNLQQLAQSQQATLFMLLHSVLALTLARHSGRKDVVIGTINANRQLVEVENLIGCFVNTVALYTDTDFSLLSELIAHVREVNLAAQQHGQMELEQVADLLGVPSGSNHMRLVQIVFSMDTSAKTQLQLPDVSLNTWPRQQQTGAKFDLEIIAYQSDGTIQFDFIYNQALFERGRIERMAKHLQCLLNLIGQSPQTAAQLPLAKMSMLDNDEMAHLMALANLQPANSLLANSWTEDSIVNSLLQVLAERADFIAIENGEQQIRYGQLENRIVAMVQMLQSRGVKSADCVGICIEDGFDLVAGFFAIMSIGAVVVPMASNSPQVRVDHMVSDSNMALLLVCDRSLATLSHHQALVLNVSEQTESVAGVNTQFNRLADVVADINPEQAAYIIYTSGSTGLPKGVVISHGNWLAYLHSARALYQPQSDDRVLQFSSPAFDIFIEELSLSILSGAALIFNPQQTLVTSSEFWRFVAANNISVASLPTAYWHGLCSDGQLAQQLDDTSLRLMILGGEALQIGQLKRWQQAKTDGQIELINTYGPTETTVIATAWRATTVSENCSNVPIGQPVAASSVIVLDEDNQFTPFGAVGELCIVGPSVALGYHGLIEQTEKQFCQISVGNEVFRAYRSGDLVRYLDSGDLVFVGRKDRQVKIRGFRVEPGEIEQVISNIAGVDDAAVTVQQHGESWQVIAYISGDIAADALTARFEQDLAQYMQPTHVVRLTQIPLTINGKVDYRALPIADESHVVNPLAIGLTQLPELTELPETDIEHQLADVWRQVLGLDSAPIGINQSFFKTGGDSILAVRLLAAINQAFGCDISLKQFFTQPSITGLAAILQQREIASEVPAVGAIESRVNADDVVFASSQQNRLWMLQQLSEGDISTAQLGAYNIAHTFNLTGEVDVERLAASFAAIVAAHDSLRTVFLVENYQLMQRCIPQVATHEFFTFIDLTVNSDKAVTPIAQHHFDLSQDCLLQVQLVKTAPLRYQLMICIHHIAADGWSVSLITEALNQLYNSNVPALELSANAPSIGYRDYSVWQQQQLSSDQHQADSAYWQQQLADLPQCHDLPLDHPRPVRQSYSGALYQQTIPIELTAQLRQFAQQQDVTLFMLLHSIFALLIARFSNSTDIAIGTAVANRPLAQQSDVIGCFINALVLRSQCDENSDFNQLLANNKAMILDGFAHQSLGFESLVEQLSVERNPAFSPLFQIMFVLHNNRRLPLQLTGVDIGHQPDEQNAGAKYDLTLNSFDCDGKLSFDWEFNPDLFDLASIRALADHWLILAKQVMAQPQVNVWQLPLVCERPQVIETHRCKQTVMQLFTEQVLARPQATAVIAGEQSLNYHSLSLQVDALANGLNIRGVKAGDRVGIKLDHQLQLPVALLAVMKVGAVYVPLDIDIPLERERRIIEQAQLKLIITEQDELLTFRSDITPAVADSASANEVAYVLFTSGSTGEPKGVEVSHGALANLLLSMAKTPGFSANDRLLAVTPLSFDISGLELYLPLICGGTLVLGGKRLATDADSLAQLLVDADITMMQATPTMWRILLDSQWQGKEDLVALCGGEALNLEQAHLLAAKTRQLWNMYGPTETTIWSFCGQVMSDCQQVSIGQPIDNTDFCILDKFNHPLPPGVVGQLYICGAGLAQGYLNRAELTSQAFVEFDGVRWYATGDLVRLTHDQQLIFMGRVDHQIKLRGFRIEPGEIENRLNLHPSISDSLVVLHTDSHSNRQSLVAYYVASTSVASSSDANSALTAEALQAYLAEYLPAYMLPNLFEPLTAFSLTPSGKKDRKALPKPQHEMSFNIEQDEAIETFVAPQNKLEEFIAEKFKQLLGREQISSQSNFFAMGATSLDLVNLARDISDHINYKVSAVELFDKTNISQLADWLETLIVNKNANNEVANNVSVNSSNNKAVTRADKRDQGKSRLQARLNRRRGR